MNVSRSLRGGILSVLLLSIWPAAPLTEAAGFGIFEQGTKATGMANAFTAQADDPSAMFYNAGGLGFLEGRDFLAGAALVFLGDSQYNPITPAATPLYSNTGTQVDQLKVPIHFYWVEPIGENLNFGLGLETPFGLTTEWDNPELWPGQFISITADLQALDLNPSIGWQITKKLGIGGGIIVRGSNVDLLRSVGQDVTYPLTPGPVEVPIARLSLESDFETGFGFNLGLLHKPSKRLSWGLSYRSEIGIDYGGSATFSQTPIPCPPAMPPIDPFCMGVDNMVAQSGLPFGQALPITTSIDFPAMASFGIAYKVSRTVLLEWDINWTGWSSFDTTQIQFTGNPQFNSTIVSNWDDANNYRFGLLWDASGRGEWRFGAYFDESPQPDESVSPLLPDANRAGISAGYGWPINKKTDIDLALMYVRFADRTTTTNSDGFNGTYKSKVWIASASIGF